eukprot:4453767-Prymnesium_polylepis.1
MSGHSAAVDADIKNRTLKIGCSAARGRRAAVMRAAALADRRAAHAQYVPLVRWITGRLPSPQ